MKMLVTAVALPLIVAAAGAQWEPPVRLTWNDSASHTSFNSVHCLAGVEPSTLHLVWYDHRTGTDQVFYKRSTDNGTTWSQDTALTSGDGSKTDPALATSSDFVYLVWEDRRGGYNSQVYFRRSTDNGATWEPEVRLNFDNYMSRNPCVCAEAGRVHVAWASDSVGREIYYLRSTDCGVTWGEPRRLTFDVQESWYPSLAAVGNVVHLVWRDWRDHSFEVYYLRSATYGETWDTTPVRLSGDVATGSYNPCIAASGPGAHVIWWDCRNTPYELYYRRSTNYGNTWEPGVRLTTDTTGSYNPSIAALGPNVYVAWEALYGTSYIMYKQSSDVGETWSSDLALTVPPDFWSVSPCVAVLGEGIHLVWTEFRDSEQGEIYYVRNLHVSGTAERCRLDAASPRVNAAIVRGVLELPPSASRMPPTALLDFSGRKVLDLHPGANDVSQLAPGVYFVRSTASGQRSAIRRIVIAR